MTSQIAPENVAEKALLLLGRLDGRLKNSAWTDIWLARARLRGASDLASLAGAPVTLAALQDWVCGRAPPPRASEGLNDPVAVAAVFHFAVQAGEDLQDPLARATVNLLRTILDDRAEAELWAGEDVVHFGPAWREARAKAMAPYPTPSLSGLAGRIIEIHAAATDATADAVDVVSIDGRKLTLAPRTRDRTWLIASHVPAMLHHSGLTLRLLPSLVLLPKFLPSSVTELTLAIAAALLRACEHGLKDLDWIERAGPAALPARTTRRSRAPLLARLELAYPDLRPAAIARLLGVSPQGARKMRAAIT